MEIQLRLSEIRIIRSAASYLQKGRQDSDPFPMLKLLSFCTTILGRVLYEV